MAENHLATAPLGPLLFPPVAASFSTAQVGCRPQTATRTDPARRRFRGGAGHEHLGQNHESPDLANPDDGRQVEEGGRPGRGAHDAQRRGEMGALPGKSVRPAPSGEETARQALVKRPEGVPGEMPDGGQEQLWGAADWAAGDGSPAGPSRR